MKDQKKKNINYTYTFIDYCCCYRILTSDDSSSSTFFLVVFCFIRNFIFFRCWNFFQSIKERERERETRNTIRGCCCYQTSSVSLVLGWRMRESEKFFFFEMKKKCIKFTRLNWMNQFSFDLFAMKLNQIFMIKNW